MSRYFVDEPSLKNILNDRRELRGATSVGVEYGDMKVAVQLVMTDRGLEVRSDDAFTIAPQASNVTLIVPREDYHRDSRIEEVKTPQGDRLAAEQALDLLFGLATKIEDAKTTRTAASRKLVSHRIRSYVRALKRVI